MKNELRERERDAANNDIKEGYAKQELIRDIKDREEREKKLLEELDKKRKDNEDRSKAIDKMKEEMLILKATVNETDKSREIIVREMNHMKDLENDRVKEVEMKKNAELKMMEKINAGLKADKKEQEQRIQDLITK